MFDRSSKKLGLDQAVLSNINNEFSDKNQKAPQLDKQAIDALLKYGAYDLFSKEDDEASKKFCEEDIDKILERATTVVHKTEDTGLSSFSKATFASSASGNPYSFIRENLSLLAPELDINDPDFWKKLLPDAANAPDPLIQAQPRERKRVHRFGADEPDDSDISQEEEESDFEITEEPANEKKWNESERTRFKKALMQYGYGRWTEIQDKAKLSKWTLAAVENYGKAFLGKLASFKKEEFSKVEASVINIPDAEKQSKELDQTNIPPVDQAKDGAELTEESKVDKEPPSETAEPTESSTVDVSFDTKADEYFDRNAKQLVKRLQNVAYLGRIIRSCATPLKDLAIPTVPDLPAADWNEDDDRSLLVGAYPH
jgi:hypothetical protein